jgi:peptidoglycan/xylan/chitin deacetylase (PgdA/CDA1 family)
MLAPPSSFKSPGRGPIDSGMTPLRAVYASLLALAAALLVAGCGAGSKPAAPVHVHLTAAERAIWRPLPVTRAGIPVLAYHGIGRRSDFANPADSAYGITKYDFAKQMALLQAGGYHAITLEQFRAWQEGRRAALPAHPLLLTFDDSLTNSFDGADDVLRKLGWTAVMFVDVGHVAAGAPGYASWARLAAAQRSGRWELQLHAGRGHHNIAYDAAGTTGPFYAYRAGREGIGDWWRRAVGDLEWGQAQLAAHVPGYKPLAFAPPYGNYGQVSTNDPLIPRRLGAWLRDRFGLVFVQQPAAYARRGDTLVPRLQITRRMAGGEVHAWLGRQLPR